MKRSLVLLLAAFLGCACSAGPVHYGIEVVKEYPHDEASYTQGLFFHEGSFYESTGQWGESTFRQVDLETGKALKRLDFNRKYFVEGSVILGSNLYVLTWTNKVVFVYDASTLEYKSSYSYPREGWGLTTDGKSLIASDGSSKLYFLSEDLKLERSVTVKMEGRSVKYINELEWVDGRIWANVYTTDLILIINPSSGEVEGVVDCKGLLSEPLKDSRTDVLNGIAENNGHIYLTGKYWKRLYEVRLVRKKK